MNFMNKKSILSLALAITLGVTGCNSSSNSNTPTVKVNNFDSTNFTQMDLAKLYIATYNKPPTYKVITDLMAQMKQSSFRSVAHSLAEHVDTTIYPRSQTTADFVETLFRTIYNRPSTPEEKQEWVDKMYKGEILKEDMWMEFVYAAKGDDEKVIENKLEVARYYADQKKGEDYSLIFITKDPSSVEKAKREIDALKDESEMFPDATLSLTINDDYIEGGAGFDIIDGRIINGTQQTLQKIDYIDGGGGYDILRATVIANTAPQIKNVEEIQVRFAGDDDKAVFDLLNTNDIEHVKVMLSTQVGTFDHIGGINVVDVISTKQDVNLKKGNSQDIKLKTIHVGSPEKEVVINFSDNPTTQLSIDTISSVFTYDQNNSGSTVTGAGINLEGDNTIRLKAGEKSLEKIVLDGTGSVNLAPGNGSMMDQFMLKAVQKLEASNDVGDVKMYVDNSDEATLGYVKTSNGVDEIFIYSGGGQLRKEGKSLRGSLKIKLGGGDDTMIIMASNANKIPASIQIDGEGGMENKLAVNSDVATTLEEGVQENGFDDFSVFIIIDKLDGDVDMSKMDDMQIVVLADKYTDDSSIAGLENKAFITFTTDIDDNDGDTKITVTGTGVQDENTNDVYNINFMAAADTDFGDLVVHYIENLNFLTNDGGIKKMAIIDGDLRTINVTGNSILDIYEKPLKTVTKVTVGDAGARINISGDGGVKQEVVTGSGEDQIALGDGDGKNANICRVGRGDDNVTGGTGEDIVDLNSGDDVYYSSPGADSITLGTGADIVVYRNKDDSKGGSVDEIKDFVMSEDQFDFRLIVDSEGMDDGAYLGDIKSYGELDSTFTGNGDKLEVVLVRDDHRIYIDTNGDKNADMIIDLSTNQVDTLSSNNFIFK